MSAALLPGLAPSPIELRGEEWVETQDGARLHTTHEGTGPAVVLCGGVGCDGFIWRYLRPALAEHFRVIHLTPRGHGKSTTGCAPSELRVDTLARDFFRVLDHYGEQRATLVGHSMGAQLILEAALNAPLRVRTLIPMAGTYGRLLTSFFSMGLAPKPMPLAAALLRRYPKASRSIWKRAFASELAYRVGTRIEVNPSLAKREDFEAYLHSLARTDPEVVIALLEELERHDIEHRLVEIGAPALVVTGPNDNFTPSKHSRRMAELMPRATLAEIKGTGHLSAIERPHQVNERVLEFLRRHH